MSEISIEMNREMIDVSTRGSHVPDPRWSHTDSHGHIHRFDDRDLPSLEWVVTEVYWCDECRDEHEEGEWRCRICGEVVEPRYNFTGPEHRTIPGLLDIKLWIDDTLYPISMEQAIALRGLEGDALREKAHEVAAEIAAMREP